jgi:hypothetical protein
VKIPNEEEYEEDDENEMLNRYGTKGRAPKELEDSAQAFNPGNRRPEHSP